MPQKEAIKKSFWIPMSIWNLNELFTTESLSPVSFYKTRNFGNPVNRNQTIEDENNLVLFDNAVQSDILLNLSQELLSVKYLYEIKSKKNTRLKSYKYTKTIYLKKGSFKIYFCSQEKLNEFLNSAFMLLEVKTVNKYKTDFLVDEILCKKQNNAYYQTRLLTIKEDLQPHFDKAFNQFKGMVYGYIIGSIGTLGINEQNLLAELSKLKNNIAGIHTDIVLSEQYSNLWLLNVHKQIMRCKKSYFDSFKKNTDVFDMLLLRLKEIDNLNKMRCIDLTKQKSPAYKYEYENEQVNLEKAKRDLYEYEYNQGLITLKEELAIIKKEEKDKGKSKGKTREYYKKGSKKYDRKKELKEIILAFENNPEYQALKKEVEKYEERIRNFQFGYTQYDTSITEQFSRISEYLNEIIKKTTNYFLSVNNKSTSSPDISFDLDLSKLTLYYLTNKNEYIDFIVQLPQTLSKVLTEKELQLISITINSLLTQPQGRLGTYSEKGILDIIIKIGDNLPEGLEKQTLRNYYLYRTGKSDNFIFPDNQVLANLLVFLIKLNGHDQINKMVNSKNIGLKQIAFMFYGTYIGFANLPKTFTNIIFERDNYELLDYIDDCLFQILKKYEI